MAPPGDDCVEWLRESEKKKKNRKFKDSNGKLRGQQYRSYVRNMHVLENKSPSARLECIQMNKNSFGSTSTGVLAIIDIFHDKRRVIFVLQRHSRVCFQPIQLLSTTINSLYCCLRDVCPVSTNIAWFCVKLWHTKQFGKVLPYISNRCQRIIL